MSGDDSPAPRQGQHFAVFAVDELNEMLGTLGQEVDVAVCVRPRLAVASPRPAR